MSLDINTVVIVATLLGGVTAIWFLMDKLIKAVRTQKVYFPDTTENFYNYYSKVFSGAKEEIWVSSDGFNMRNAVSREYAEIMKRATRDALERGVEIYRLQILDTMHLNWIPQLKALKEEYPNSFRVWVNPPLPSLPSVCVIDPKKSDCVSERMQDRLGIFGQGSVAHTFNFTHGDKKLALQTKQIIQEAIDHPGARELKLNDFESLYEDLLSKRMQVLRAWCASQDVFSIDDLSVSGIFDEIVITRFIREQSAGTSAATET